MSCGLNSPAFSAFLADSSHFWRNFLAWVKLTSAGNLETNSRDSSGICALLLLLPDGPEW